MLQNFSTNSSNIFCLIQFVICKLAILLRPFRSLYDVEHEWWWMFVVSKLNVGLIILLNTILLFFALGYLYKISVVVNAFDICWQQFELKYWMSSKFCMHLWNLFINYVLVCCITIVDHSI